MPPIDASDTRLEWGMGSKPQDDLSNRSLPHALSQDMIDLVCGLG